MPHFKWGILFAESDKNNPTQKMVFDTINNYG